jgi:DNA-binding transcriptional regulator YiaG
MTIEWRPIPGFSDYEVSDTGLVRSYKWKRPHILKPGIHPGGYHQVGLRRNGETHIFMVSHLVLFAFQGPCPENCEVCHNDGNPANDHLSNLRWDTHAANMRDMSQHNIALERVQTYLTSAIENEAFVHAVRTTQRKLEMTQEEFAEYIGIHQASLSKFYSRGIKDGIVIKVLRKHPDLAHLL